MALLQRKPQISENIQLYTLGLNKIVLLVGLGNPGTKYDGTRHNVGFECLDDFIQKNELEPWSEKKDLSCHLSSSNLGNLRVIAIKPTTFMNLSGQAVQAVAKYYQISPESIVVIHDELDVDFGQIRTRIGGSAAGHNGLKSIIKLIGEDFGRVRIGIGPKTPAEIDSADFVLQKFSKKEQAELGAMHREVSAILSEYVYSGGNLPNDTRSFLI